MNTPERELLISLLQQLGQAKAAPIDAEAERLIQEACARQPDSSYLLVQRCLLLEKALGNAQAELARLRQNQEGARSGSSFLNSNGWGNTPAQAMPTQRAAIYDPVQNVPVAPAAMPGWGSGMLGTVATTAAGAVAGAFLFQGIQNMMGNHGNSSGLLAESKPAAPPAAPPDSLVSNQPDDVSAPPVDLDSLGPSDDDSAWS